VESYGARIGIAVVAVSFVFFHLLVGHLSSLEILASSILFLLVGSLYHLAGSFYLVGALHGTLNFLPALLEAWPQPSSQSGCVWTGTGIGAPVCKGTGQKQGEGQLVTDDSLVQEIRSIFHEWQTKESKYLRYVGRTSSSLYIRYN